MLNTRIVLVEPAGALNVGSVARVMKNMGFSQLVVVNPHCDIHSAEAHLMAVRGRDILAAARGVDSLPDALVGCQRVIATIGRDRDFSIPLEPPRQALPWLLEAADSALIFGREDRGLSNDELKYAQRLVQIPANPDYPSLNLAQSVAICCYELAMGHHAQAEGHLEPSTAVATSSAPQPHPLSSFEALEAFCQDLETLLLTVGYLHPHTAPSRMEKLRRLLHRSDPAEQEVAMLRGIVRQVRWALQNLPKNLKV